MIYDSLNGRDDGNFSSAWFLVLQFAVSWCWSSASTWRIICGPIIRHQSLHMLIWCPLS